MCVCERVTDANPDQIFTMSGRVENIFNTRNGRQVDRHPASHPSEHFRTRRRNVHKAFTIPSDLS